MERRQSLPGYTAVPGTECSKCAFDNERKLCWSVACTAGNRDDKTSVIFVKEEKKDA